MFFRLLGLSLWIVFNSFLNGNPSSLQAFETGPSCSSVLTVDYLCWEVKSEALPYGYTFGSNGAPPILAPVEVQRVEPTFHSGVRLGMNFLVPCSTCWDIDLRWTYLPGNAKDSVTASNILPIWMAGTTRPSATGAQAKYKVSFNLFDLSLARRFCISHRVALSPFVGLKGAWIDQDFRIHYSGVLFQDAPVAGGSFIDCKNKIKYRGWGLHAGLNSDWYMKCGFSLFAHGACDLLWSHAKVNEREILPSGALRSSTDDSNLRMVNPVFELLLGLGWSSRSCSPCRFNCHVGWEMHYMMNLVQFSQFTDDFDHPRKLQQRGNLGLGGLTAGVSINF